MEPVGATASILTFVTVAFSATKSIYGALSAIKDGPEILGSINDEISQLQNILQRLLQVVSSTARPADRSKLEQMVKKCRDDLVGFEAKLRKLDVSGANGRRGLLWRKFKICFEEKDLDRMRRSVGSHVQLLTLYLCTIQDQQSSLIATQSTEILARIHQLQQTSPTATRSTEILAGIQQLQHTLPTATQLNEVLVTLQQLQQDMAVLQVSSTSSQTKIGSLGISSRVVGLDDENSPISQQTTLDDTIARLMRLLEKKPCTVEFDDAQEIFDDLERLLQSVLDDANFTKVGEGGVDQDADVSKEMKLFTSLIFSAQSLRVNQTESMNSFEATEPRVGILQQRKRKEMDTGDNVLTVTTVKRRRRILPVSQGGPHSELTTKRAFMTMTRMAGLYCMNPLTIAYDHGYDVNFSEVLLCAGADPTVDLKGHPRLVNVLAFAAHIEPRNILHRTFCISPFVLPAHRPDDYDVMFYFCQAWLESSAEDFNPGQERQTLDLLISHGYNLQTFEGKQTGLHGFFSSERKSFSRVPERRDLLTYLISKGADPCMADSWGQTPSQLAYGSMCKPCSMSQSSLMGDLWDTVLDICGYDISIFRRNYPRKASYRNGYSRETFEELWRGREERCPYWNDEPWPEFSTKEAKSTFESTIAQGLCTRCDLCCSGDYSDPCYNCGICLLIFRYSCPENFDLDHEHDSSCPRSRVGYFERSENDGQYNFRPKRCSDSDSDDEESDYDQTSSSSDEFEDERSLSDPGVTSHRSYDFEEIISEDELDGGVSL
ncbi:hypothetical protein FMUND_1821 [Fusarium mundagurra]|uniref:Azaphilone pigments biosynthesis cluster protein L N-terminal domain-containing protein n=1 Tax=Fusarium mundagurra TaxID=1567541 RepID=A0A8H5Z5V1_9HYPO|nr:hypothetical protein FMUND_1821 [Fusarium mundagurra]